MAIAIPFWLQWDDGNTLVLEKEDFFMVCQDTLTELGSKFSLQDEQVDQLTATLDEHFDALYEKHSSSENMGQSKFFRFVDELVTIYNKEMEESEEESDDKKIDGGALEAMGTRVHEMQVRELELIRTLQQKQLEYRDTKQNTELYSK